MNIIVTGGAGFIGSNFVFHMLKKYPDYRIICLDKLTYAGNLSTLAPVMNNPNFRFVKADICDREAVNKLFEEEHPDIVVNFAAESHVDRSIEDPGIFLQTNIIGTSVLMDACRKYGIQRYTYDLARLLVDMNETEKYGYYHATNEGGYISWYDFTKEIYRQAGYKTEVLPVSTEEYGLSKAARPFNSRLDKSKLVEAGFTPLPTWQDALSRYLKEIEQ